MELPVYIIVKKTGQFDREGRELCIVFDAKLTRSAAEAVALANPGTEVIKRIADKEAN